MTQKKTTWRSTCNRFVAFMDIMGFTDWVYRSSHNSVLSTMTSFRTVVQDLERDVLNPATRIPGPGTHRARHPRRPFVRLASFSDSILVISSDHSFESANWTICVASVLVAVAAEHGMGMKGAIAYGRQTADFENSLQLGRPLIDAYHLQDELQMYGLVLHHSAEEQLALDGTLSKFEGGLLHRYSVPFKSGRSTHYLVDLDLNIVPRADPYALLAKLYGRVSGSTRIYVDNTAEFMRWVKDRTPPS